MKQLYLGALCLVFAFCCGYGVAVHEQKIDREKAEAAVQAQLSVIKKASAEIEKQYDDLLKDAKAVAVANASTIDRLRKRLASVNRQSIGSTAIQRGLDLADRATDLAGWCVRCNQRLSELSAKLSALQKTVRVSQ